MSFPRASTDSAPRPLRVEWRDSSERVPVVFFRYRPSPVRIRGTATRLGRAELGSRWTGCRSVGSRPATAWRSSRAGFTLIEMLTVLVIIGLLATLTLPHLRGMTKSNNMQVATRQLLDDIAFARKRAIVNRSTVYMVFAPSNPWNFINFQTASGISKRSLTNAVMGQYRGYVLLSLRTVGDQPGRWTPSFITDWKTLPSGVFIATNLFDTTEGAITITTTSTLANGVVQSVVTPFYVNSNVAFPFPSLQNFATNLPYIGFSPNGGLVTESGAPTLDQYIALTSGGILYPQDNNGVPLPQPPLISESSIGEWTNNPTLIHIDATSGRARLEHNGF